MRSLKQVTSLVCLSYLLSEMRLVRATSSAKLPGITDSYQCSHEHSQSWSRGYSWLPAHVPCALICANGSCQAYDQERAHHTIIWHYNREWWELTGTDGDQLFKSDESTRNGILNLFFLTWSRILPILSNRTFKKCPSKNDASKLHFSKDLGDPGHSHRKQMTQ